MKPYCKMLLTFIFCIKDEQRVDKKTKQKNIKGMFRPLCIRNNAVKENLKSCIYYLNFLEILQHVFINTYFIELSSNKVLVKLFCSLSWYFTVLYIQDPCLWLTRWTLCIFQSSAYSTIWRYTENMSPSHRTTESEWCFELIAALFMNDAAVDSVYGPVFAPP